MKSDDYEHSEMLLYQIMILEESENAQEAFNFLNEFKDQIVDCLAIMETKGRDMSQRPYHS